MDDDNKPEDKPVDKSEDKSVDNPELTEDIKRETQRVESMASDPGVSTTEIMAELKALPDRISSLVSQSVSDAVKPIARAAKRTDSNPVKNNPPEDKVEDNPSPIKRGPFARLFDGGKW